MLTHEGFHLLTRSVKQQESLKQTLRFFARQRNLKENHYEIALKLALGLRIEEETEAELRAAEAHPDLIKFSRATEMSDIVHVEQVEAAIKLRGGVRYAFTGTALEIPNPWAGSMMARYFSGEEEPPRVAMMEMAVRWGADIMRRQRRVSAVETLVQSGMRPRRSPVEQLNSNDLSVYGFADYEIAAYQSMTFTGGVPDFPPVEQSTLDAQQERMDDLRVMLASLNEEVAA